MLPVSRIVLLTSEACLLTWHSIQLNLFLEVYGDGNSPYTEKRIKVLVITQFVLYILVPVLEIILAVLTLAKTGKTEKEESVHLSDEESNEVDKKVKGYEKVKEKKTYQAGGTENLNEGSFHNNYLSNASVNKMPRN